MNNTMQYPQALLLLLAQCLALPALAQERSALGADIQLNIPSSVSRSVIDGDVLANARGRIGINAAAGNSNAQSNSSAIAASRTGQANARATALVRIEDSSEGVQSKASAMIDGNAFAGARGMLSINQASGNANAQANVMAIGLGANPDAVAESVLSSTVSGIATSTASRGHAREATISDGAFRGARGLVQVNQSAGSGNRTANHFALQVQTTGSRP